MTESVEVEIRARIKDMFIAWSPREGTFSTVEIETGKTLDTTQQVTLIWERQGGTWRIVHEHLSGPVRM